MLYLGAMEGVKLRKSSITAKDVSNPFAHRNSLHKTDADSLDSSDSSLTIDDFTAACSGNKKSSAAMLYTVKILSLLLVGFAAGLLYHLVFSASDASVNNPSVQEALEEHEFLTDDLIHKLASQNQYQEQEMGR